MSAKPRLDRLRDLLREQGTSDVPRLINGRVNNQPFRIADACGCPTGKPHLPSCWRESKAMTAHARESRAGSFAAEALDSSDYKGAG